jgi:hypothetical protein
VVVKAKAYRNSKDRDNQKGDSVELGKVETEKELLELQFKLPEGFYYVGFFGGSGKPIGYYEALKRVGGHDYTKHSGKKKGK